MTTTPTENPIPNIPFPVGSCQVDGWTDAEFNDPHRCFSGSTWRIGRDDDDDIGVEIVGIQRPDGRISRKIWIADGKHGGT
ncbi:hypothetical protein A5641_00755 [Mycobacterium sp. 1554424.7]|nr:hypothetical protein A5641_00755 [Mycobacterium sp. 1554424.7]